MPKSGAAAAHRSRVAPDIHGALDELEFASLLCEGAIEYMEQELGLDVPPDGMDAALLRRLRALREVIRRVDLAVNVAADTLSDSAQV